MPARAARRPEHIAEKSLQICEGEWHEAESAQMMFAPNSEQSIDF